MALPKIQVGVWGCLGLASVCAALLAQCAWAQAEEPNFGGVTGRREPMGTEQAPKPATWLEVIEVYTLPWDPQWREAATKAEFPSGFRRSAEELERELATLAKRAKDLSPSSPAMKAHRAKQQKLLERLRAAADRDVELTVVRAWDGIKRNEVILTFGRGQRALLDRLKPGKPVLGVIDPARPGDDLQAVRTTLAELRQNSSVPSDLLRAADAPEALRELAFGEVDPSALPRAVFIAAKRDTGATTGVFHLEIPRPPIELGISPDHPWYAEFRVHELDRDGTRIREVRFEGASAVVATELRQVGLSGFVGDRATAPRVDIAIGRFKVKSPHPWGYEAEIVKWYGVAPKDRLIRMPKQTGGGEGTGAASVPGGSSDGTSPPQLKSPAEGTVPSAFFEETASPSVPETGK